MSFQVGREAVAIMDVDDFIVKGRIYTIYAMDRCCRLWLDVGIPEGSDPDYESDECPYCGTPASVNNRTVFYLASNFRPVEPLADVMDRIEQEASTILEPIPA